MTRRCATLYGLLAVFALLLSTVVAWSCALWSPMRGSRSLPQAEVVSILTDEFGATSFASTPSGLEQSGVGMSLTLAGDAAMPVPTREQFRSRPNRNRGGRRISSFSLMPSSPDDKTIQLFRAGWPLPCLQGAKKTVGGSVEHDGVIEPPGLMDNLGIKPRRMLPLYPRWAALAVDTLFYGAVFWLAVPGPRMLRRHLRRRRALCPHCGYDTAHHEHEMCPECGAS